MKTKRMVALLVLSLVFLVLLYLPFTWPSQGTRHIILHNLQKPSENVANILTKPRFSKMLHDHDETNLKELKCSKTLNPEDNWRILKNLLFQDLELNLIDCGIGCGFLALAAAKSGRHVLAIHTHESKITAFRDKIILNELDLSLIQYSHLSVHIKEQNIETIVKSAVFHRAVLKIEGPLQTDDHSSISEILQSKDISSIMIIDNRNCQDFNKFIIKKKFFPVDEYLQKTEDHCQNPGIWLRESEDPPSKGSVITKTPNIVNPDQVPSLLNYINCVRVPDPNHHEICYSTLDRYIGKSLENKGTWDPFIWHPMKSLLWKDPELGLIDIGANIGVFSLKAASMGRPVLAIEAFYPNIQRFAESIRINEFQNLITVAHNAVSNDYQTVYLSSPVDNPGGTTARFFLNTANRGKYRTAQSVTLNDFVHLAPMKAVVKVDIESSEGLAFQKNSVNKLLDEIEIPAVFMEWTGLLQFVSCVDIVEMFLSRGYKAYGLAYEDWWIPGFQMPLYGKTYDEIKMWPKDIVWLKSK